MRVAVLTCLLLCLPILAACQDSITFHVVDAGGKPVPGALVGVTRFSTITGQDKATPEDEIPVEAVVTCDSTGSATYTPPAGTPGLDHVLVWAAADGYTPALTGGLALKDRIPTVGEVRREGVQALDLTRQREITITLSSPVGRTLHEQVAMRDGIKLATDVYLPQSDGPWPVMLLRTPYNKDGLAEYAAQGIAMGFAWVVQDMRGRYRSAGANLPFIADGWGAQQDGYDTCQWLTQQDWCDGNIGTLGNSALGITQNLTAPTQPPGLRCQYITVATTSLYDQAAYQGGALRQSQVDGWLTDSKFDPQALELYRGHPDYDEFWRQFDISTVVGQITAPAIHEGGWFDTFSQGTIDGYVLRQHLGGKGARGDPRNRLDGAGARGQQRLIMGPWTHSTGVCEVGEVTFPANAAGSPGNWRDRWFAYWLQGQDTGLLAEPPVLYYTMGALGEDGAPGNEWCTAADWPVPCTQTPVYLAADDALAWQAPAAGSAEYASDPADPVPTKGGRNLVLAAGVMDQREVEAREDVLIFTTPPLEHPLNVTGRVKCVLYLSSDAVDTDAAVRLCDVYPDGRSLLIADGILRLGHRNDMTRREPLTPDQVYAVEVDLWSTSLIFNTGHCLRLSVSGSNFPRWDLNPGTGVVWTDGCEYVVQHDTLHYGGAYASALILPVVQ
jgi:uncharacterized protein